MKVLVTGGAGYIGAQLVYELSQKPEVTEVIVYDNLSRGNYNLFISSSNKINKGNVKFIQGDLLDSRKLKKSIKGVEVVYHLAAKVAAPYQDVDSHFYEQVNNWGTAELVYAIDETESVKKVVYLSTTNVYPGHKQKVYGTDAEANPRTFYSISKLRGEEHVLRLNSRIEAVILRCGNVYGYSPAIRFDSVINKFLFESHFNNRIQIHGSGKQSRSFIHIDKLVNILLEVPDAGLQGGIYNLTDKNIQVLDLVDVFKEIYPELEFIFINQHLELRDLKVDQDNRINGLYKGKEVTLKEELVELRNKSFAFS